MINLYLKVYKQRFDIVVDRVHNMMCLRWFMLATLTNLLRNTINNWRLRLGNKIKTSGGLFHSLYHGGGDVWDQMKTDSKTILYVLITNSLPANLIFQKLYIMNDTVKSIRINSFNCRGIRNANKRANIF